MLKKIIIPVVALALVSVSFAKPANCPKPEVSVCPMPLSTGQKLVLKFDKDGNKMLDANELNDMEKAKAIRDKRIREMFKHEKRKQQRKADVAPKKDKKDKKGKKDKTPKQKQK